MIMILTANKNKINRNKLYMKINNNSIQYSKKIIISINKRIYIKINSLIKILIKISTKILI